ncbi:hypothetical protein CTTA_0013 [Comamonas testosteroni]|uniref:Uncharacterized protein n=1 Tax=Comamonas testosteroni TaxID=285 RepID=A0A5A7M572_COMTE|nr:hypothetical protein [Comamonas testosteroni]GEQ73008.1 hypothetical protein CTTA_0013 [Comamonas testosteroni]
MHAVLPVPVDRPDPAQARSGTGIRPGPDLAAAILASLPSIISRT